MAHWLLYSSDKLQLNLLMHKTIVDHPRIKICPSDHLNLVCVYCTGITLPSTQWLIYQRKSLIFQMLISLQLKLQLSNQDAAQSSTVYTWINEWTKPHFWLYAPYYDDSTYCLGYISSHICFWITWPYFVQVCVHPVAPFVIKTVAVFQAYGNNNYYYWNTNINNWRSIQWWKRRSFTFIHLLIMFLFSSSCLVSLLITITVPCSLKLAST